MPKKSEETIAKAQCGQESCIEQAADRVFWPGREPIVTCEKHTKASRNVGAAIGCYIHTEPLSD